MHVRGWCAFVRSRAVQCLLVIMRVDARVFALEGMFVEGVALCIFTCVDFTEMVEWHCVVSMRVIEAQHILHVNIMIIPIIQVWFSAHIPNQLKLVAVGVCALSGHRIVDNDRMFGSQCIEP